MIKKLIGTAMLVGLFVFFASFVFSPVDWIEIVKALSFGLGVSFFVGVAALLVTS